MKSQVNVTSCQVTSYSFISHRDMSASCHRESRWTSWVQFGQASCAGNVRRTMSTFVTATCWVSVDVKHRMSATCVDCFTCSTTRCAMRMSYAVNEAVEAMSAQIATTHAVRPRCARARASVSVPSKSEKRHRSILSWMVFAARWIGRCPRLVLQRQTLELKERRPKVLPVTATTQIDHGRDIQRRALVVHAVVMEGPSEASLLPLVAFPMFRRWRWRWRRCLFIRQCSTVSKAVTSRLEAMLTPNRNSCAHDNIVCLDPYDNAIFTTLKWMYETHLTNTSSRSSTRSVFLWNCALRFKFFEVTWVHTRCKMNNSTFCCSRSMTFFFTFDFLPWRCCHVL